MRFVRASQKGKDICSSLSPLFKSVLKSSFYKSCGFLMSFLDTKASSTRIRKFVKTQIVFTNTACVHTYPSVFSGRIRKFLKTLSRAEIFLSVTNTYTCGRSYPEICEYASVILLYPVFTASIINKRGVEQGFIFFVNCSDFWFDIMCSDKCSCDKSTQPML